MLKFQVQVHTPNEIIAGIVTEGDDVQLEEVRKVLQNLNSNFPLELQGVNGYSYITPGILQKSIIQLVVEKE